MKFILVFLTVVVSFSSWAQLKVVTTTPNLEWLIKSIGGERVDVMSLLDGSEDPHYVDAMPSWIVAAAKADVFCLVGLELEVGWVPKVLERSSHPRIQPGGKGYCDAGQFVDALEVPKGKIDRSMGDIHASGNPHYHLSPVQLKNVAKGFFKILVKNDPKGIAEYKKNLERTLKEINRVEARVAKMVKGHENKKIMSYHKEFSYFIKDFGLSYVGEIEEVPGVPPSAGRIARVGLKAKRGDVDVVLASTANPKKILEKFKEISEVKYQQVPISIRKSGSPSNFEELLMGVARAITGTGQ